MRVYIKNKPKKFGFKFWCLAGQTGYVHKFYVAGNEKTFFFFLWHVMKSI